MAQPGLDSVEGDIERCLQGRDRATCLCEQQTALGGGEECESERVGVGVGWKLASLLHGTKTARESVLPDGEARDESLACRPVAAGEFAGQPPERATASAAELRVEREHAVAPAAQPGHRVESVELGLLGFQDLLHLPLHHGAHQGGLVGEVVVELRLARTRCGPDVVEACARDAALMHERRSGRQDALARRTPARSQDRVNHGRRGGHSPQDKASGPESPVQWSASKWTEQSTRPPRRRHAPPRKRPDLPVAAATERRRKHAVASHDLAGDFGVVLIYRGSWCPYCNAQLRAFARAKESLDAAGIKVVALSVDDEKTSSELVEKLRLDFPIAHSADADEVADTLGSYLNDEPRYVQSTGFVLAPDGTVVTAVYSSGAIGRLLPDDVIGLVRYMREHA